MLLLCTIFNIWRETPWSEDNKIMLAIGALVIPFISFFLMLLSYAASGALNVSNRIWNEYRDVSTPTSKDENNDIFLNEWSY